MKLNHCTGRYSEVNSLHTGYFFMLLLSFADVFQNQLYFNNSFKNAFRVSNSLDPDQT